MKKWGWKKFAVAGLAFALSFQSTAFAGEIVIFDDEESVTEATTHDSEDSEETESQTETQKETESETEQITETETGTEINTETSIETEIDSETKDIKESDVEIHLDRKSVV